MEWLWGGITAQVSFVKETCAVVQNVVSFIGLFCKRDLSIHRALHSQSYVAGTLHRSLLQKSPIKETTFCTRDI